MTNPKQSGQHVVYEVRGRDAIGNFHIKRRYNDFFALHEILSQRWPGIIIPDLPPKNWGVGKLELKSIVKEMLSESTTTD